MHDTPVDRCKRQAVPSKHCPSLLPASLLTIGRPFPSLHPSDFQSHRFSLSTTLLFIVFSSCPLASASIPPPVSYPRRLRSTYRLPFLTRSLTLPSSPRAARRRGAQPLPSRCGSRCADTGPQWSAAGPARRGPLAHGHPCPACPPPHGVGAPSVHPERVEGATGPDECRPDTGGRSRGHLHREGAVKRTEQGRGSRPGLSSVEMEGSRWPRW